jgi:hypothetical protein
VGRGSKNLFLMRSLLNENLILETLKALKVSNFALGINFSSLTHLKNKYKSKLAAENDLRLTLTNEKRLYPLP